VHPVYRTPAAAIVIQSGVALVLALSGSFVGLAMLSIIARLATYVGTAAAVPILRKRFPGRAGVVRLPGGYAIPVAALALCLVFLASAELSNLAAGAVALLVGVVIYKMRRRPPMEPAVTHPTPAAASATAPAPPAQPPRS
jgi:amino acid transporter